MSDLVVVWNEDGSCTVTGDIEASSSEEAQRIMRQLVAEAAFEAGIMPQSIETAVMP